jgi:hypothetical protein
MIKNQVRTLARVRRRPFHPTLRIRFGPWIVLLTITPLEISEKLTNDHTMSCHRTRGHVPFDRELRPARRSVRD